MLYESYERRVRKFYAFKNILYKYRILLIALAATIAALFGAFSGTKGIIHGVSVPDTIVYGDELEIEAKALFSGVDFEYRLQGGEWTKQKPRFPGDYQVRLTSSPIFGKRTQTYDFKILPKKVSIEIKEKITDFKGRQSELSVNTDFLVGEDRIADIKFKFDDLSQNKTGVVVEELVIKDAFGNDVTACYDPEFIKTEIEFSPCEITIVLINKEKTYDGIALTSDEFEFGDATGLLAGHRLEIQTVGSQTNVGSSANQILKATVWDGNVDVTNNYRINFVSGKLEVLKRHLTVKPADATKTYDGTPLVCAEAEVLAGELVKGHRIEIKTSGSRTEAGRSENAIEELTIWDGEADVTGNYEISIETGILEVTPLRLGIKTADAAKTYDGTPLSASGVEIIAGSLLPGHILVSVLQETIIDAGSKNNAMEVAIFDGADNDVTANYQIEFTEGILEIFPRELKIQTGSSAKEYDGTPLNNGHFEIISGELAEGEEIAIKYQPEMSAAGQTENYFEFAIFDEENRERTHNYIIEQIPGTLEITKRQLEIKVLDKEKTYDGTPLTSNEPEILKGALVPGHSLKITAIGSRTAVGENSNEITQATILDGNGRDVTHNYELVLVSGTLRVLPREITIRTGSAGKIYDGAPLFDTGIEVVTGSLTSGESIFVYGFTEIVDVGSSENILEFGIVDGSGNNKTENYEITSVWGYLEIFPAPLTIKPRDAEKVYDGTPLTGSEAEVSAGVLAPGHSIAITTNGSQTEVGESNNVIIQSAILDVGGRDVTQNYELTFEPGFLKVLPRKITLRTGSSEKIYDGSPLFNEFYEVSAGELAPGESIEVDGYPGITDVGEIENIFSFKILRDGLDKQHNYEITNDWGTLKVLPRSITFRTGSSEKIYDGSPLFNEFYEVSVGELAPGESIEVDGYPEIINVGEIENVFAFRILRGGADKKDNYEITFEWGTLKVLPRKLSLRTASAREVYDGYPLAMPYYELTDGSLAPNERIIIESYTRLEYAGTEDNVLKVQIISVDDETDDRTGNYEISYEWGVLEMLPRPITVKPKDAEKVYDGTPLICNEPEIVAGELAPGDTIALETYGSQTDVGESENEIAFVQIANSLHKDVTRNYEITYQTGLLEVLPSELTLKTGNAKKAYDGEALSSEDVEVLGNLAEGQRIVVLRKTYITEIGTADNALEIAVLDAADHDVTGNYEIHIVYGILEITPIPITISTASDTKEYDGTPLTNDTWSLTEGQLFQGHRLEVNVTGWILEIGKTYNLFDVGILDQEGNDVLDYYTIIKNPGILEITPHKPAITIKTGSDSKVYDGTPLRCDEWSLDEGKLLPGHELSVVVTGEKVEPGATYNWFEYEITDADGNDVSSEYHILCSYGRLLVFPPDDESNGSQDEFDYPIDNDPTPPPPGGGSLIGFKIYADVTGRLYLRKASYGDYQKSKFGPAPIYESPYGISPLSFPALALQEYGKPIHEFQLKALTAGLPYLMPYYSVDGYGDSINDAFVNLPYGSGYTLNFIFCNYEDLKEISLSGTQYETYEIAYREFVYENYLSLHESTRSEMLELARMNGLDPESPTIILDVKNYIQNAAMYNLEYKPYPENVDFAVHFLKHSKEGICQHFAMAATVMYRALGIPARFAVGFAVQTKANEWVEVGLTGHAWVEVYVDGLGWVPIEVTAGSDGGSGDGSGTVEPGPGSGDEPDEEPVNEPGDDYYEEPQSIDSEPIPSSDAGKVCFKVHSDGSVTLYLRDRSFGDYMKNMFDVPVIYESPYGISPLSFPALALIAAGKESESHVFKLEAVVSGLPYFMPYYSVDGYHGSVNDAYVKHGYGLGYTINFIPYEYSALDGITLFGTEFEEYEREYWEFVISNYLNLPESTREELLIIAAENGLNPDSPTIILDVQNFIQNAARYNEDFEAFPEDADFALHFLRNSKEGICQHFAMAATVMYRALGIPARYVVGYMVTVPANEWVEVGIQLAHAWVEVYVRGFGWVPVEVTAGGPGGGSGEPGDPGDEPGAPGDVPGDEEKELIPLTITSGNAAKKYDGTPLKCHEYQFNAENLKEGHSLQVTFASEITNVGETENRFTVIVVDEEGLDVSSQYDIRRVFGKLAVVPNDDRILLELQVVDEKRVYDGFYFNPDAGDFWIPSRNLPEGYTVKLEITGGLKDVGFVRTNIIKSSIRIYDENKFDVTNRFSIVCYSGSLEIVQREITVTSISAEKIYDGTPLTAEAFFVTPLAENDQIFVTITGSIEEVGEAENTIESVKITDREGNDVTGNYKIKTVPGVLRILHE
jgi:transglutaminase-like putative cysteine protease